MMLHKKQAQLMEANEQEQDHKERSQKEKVTETFICYNRIIKIGD